MGELTPQHNSNLHIPTRVSIYTYAYAHTHKIIDLKLRRCVRRDN